MKKVIVLCLIALSTGCGRAKSTADWVDQLKSKESAQRLHAVKALGERSREAAVVTPALALALRDEDAFVRRDAAHALGKIGPEARATTPSVVAALRDRNPGVRKAAANALKQIDPEAAMRARVK